MSDLERNGRPYQLEDTPPTAADFIALRAAEGWGSLDTNAAEAAVAASVFGVTITCDGETIGFGRIVGDGAVYFFLTDVLVRPITKASAWVR
jgi:hypothetical protein